MSQPAILRFGPFELRAETGELRRNGDLVKLAPQPLKVLEILAIKAGEIVSRAEIRERVWCGDTFVDFEQGLNFCIRQIREALGDTADVPRFIETLPRRGCRDATATFKRLNGEKLLGAPRCNDDRAKSRAIRQMSRRWFHDSVHAGGKRL